VMFASEEYKSVERAFQHGLGHRISRFGIMKEMRRQRPSRPLQVFVQMIWLVTGVGVFSMCAQKPPVAES
jgi:hypothetical protein